MDNDTGDGTRKRTRIPRQPEANASAKGIRHVTKGGLGMVPIVGPALGEVADAFLPDPDAHEQRRFNQEVGESLGHAHERIDSVEDRLGPSTTTISGAPVAALAHMLKASENGGHCEPIWELEELALALPEFSTEAVRDALGELEYHGVVERLRAIGAGVRVRLTDRAFVVGDPQIMGTDPLDDARTLAKFALEQGSNVSTAVLHSATGWNLRRFNPALRELLAHVAPNHLSGEMNPDYPARSFLLDDRERHALKRLSA